ASARGPVSSPPLLSKGESIGRGIHHAPPFDDCERRDPMWRRGSRAGDVTNLTASALERIRDERAVAPPGHGLGAHDRGAPPPGELNEFVDRGRELWRLHVVGIAAEAVVAPRAVDGIRARPAQAAELGRVQVLDAGLAHRDLEGRLGEVRHAPRSGRGADVDEGAHVVAPQQLDQVLRRARGVTDRQDLREGTTSGTRTRFVYVCPLYVNVPENRYAGS